MKTVSILLLGLAISLSGCSLHQRQEMEYAHYQDDAAAIREAHGSFFPLPTAAGNGRKPGKNTMRAFGSWPPT